LQGGKQIPSAKGKFAHVRDIEQAHRLAHRVVFAFEPGKLDWHLPAREFGHARLLL
jgi:hypothetical protein